MIDPLKLQRLVDGELGNEARAELLRMADQGNEHWREIALAFVEDQQFRMGLRERLLAAESIEFSAGGDSEVVSAPSKSGQSSNTWLRRGWAQWFCVAAALLLTSAIGYGLGKSGENPGSSSAGMTANDDRLSSATQGAESPSIANDLMASRAATASDLQTGSGEFVDINGNPMSIPVVDYEQGADFLNQPLVPDSSRVRWNESGYNVNENIRYISGHLEDGRQFVLPVRSVQFSPGQ